MQFRRTGERRFLDNLEEHEHLGTPSPEMDEYQELFHAAYGIMLDVEANRITTRKAVSQLYALYRNKEWIPPGYGLDDPTRRVATAGNLKSLILSNYWGYRRAPSEVRHRYFDFPPTELIKDIWRARSKEQAWLERLSDATQYAAFGKHRSAQSPQVSQMDEARMQGQATPAHIEMNPVPTASVDRGSSVGLPSISAAVPAGLLNADPPSAAMELGKQKLNGEHGNAATS